MLQSTHFICRSLVQRFAMPCLVLPTRPPQPACSTLQQTSTGSGAPPPCTAAAGAAMERTNGVARVQAATAVGYVPVEAGTAGSDHLADMLRASAAAGAGVAAESNPGDGLGARAEGPSVWWFAYGAALQASPGELGALESHPAVLAGEQLAGRSGIVFVIQLEPTIRALQTGTRHMETWS